jgi:hypothetical protein
MPQGLLSGMDAITKLQKKNDESKRQAGKDRLDFIGFALILSPLLFSYAYDFYFWLNGQEVELEPFWIAIGLPAFFLLSFQLFKPTIKLFLLFVCVAWFSYFWVVAYLSWYAFIPLIALYVLVLLNRQAVSKKLNDDAGI